MASDDDRSLLDQHVFLWIRIIGVFPPPFVGFLELFPADQRKGFLELPDLSLPVRRIVLGLEVLELFLRPSPKGLGRVPDRLFFVEVGHAAFASRIWVLVRDEPALLSHG